MDANHIRPPSASAQFKGTMFDIPDERAAKVIEENTRAVKESLTVPPTFCPDCFTRNPGIHTCHAWQERWASLSESGREWYRDRWRELLKPHVIQLADIAAGDGITASDVLSKGITESILNAERSFLAAHPRVYSWIGHLLATMARDGELSVKKHAGMVVRRRSERLASKGNLGVVYVAARLSQSEAA